MTRKDNVSRPAIPNPPGSMSPQRRLHVPLFALSVTAAVVAEKLWTTSQALKTGRLMERFGLRWTDLGQPRQWFRLFASSYVQPEADVTLVVLVVALLIAEVPLGTRRVATCFVLSDLLSTLIVLVALRFGVAVGFPWSATLHLRDGGMSSGSMGVAVVFLWQNRRSILSQTVGVAFAAWLIASALIDRELPSTQHFVSAAITFAFLIFRPTPTHDQYETPDAQQQQTVPAPAYDRRSRKFG